MYLSNMMMYRQSHMALSFSQTLIRGRAYSVSTTTPIKSNLLVLSPKSIKPTIAHRLLSHRYQSSHSDNFHVVDVDPSSSESELRDALAVQKIEDAIHRIIVRRSAPDWLPFLPGSSYWVPPQRKSYGIAQIVHKLSNSLTDDEVMSLTTVRGWPSSSFYLEEPSTNPAEVETPSTKLSQAEDEEG